MYSNKSNIKMNANIICIQNVFLDLNEHKPKMNT